MRQILINLLANAVKFTASGQVMLTATATPAGPHMADLGFAISDTGIGIAEHDQATLFDAFVQVDGSSTRAHQGAGLGLAISAQLAEPDGRRDRGPEHARRGLDVHRLAPGAAGRRAVAPLAPVSARDRAERRR